MNGLPKVRLGQQTDIPALAKLGRESFVAKFGHLYRPEDLSAFLEQAFTEHAISAEFANPNRLYGITEDAGNLTGYCKLSLTCGWPEYARGQTAMELKQLYTAPDRAGQGIGSVLMSWAVSELQSRGANEIQLSVWSGNEGAQRFYARYGFAKVADIQFLVGTHVDDEFLFAKML